jgi:hypothetical protein
MNRTPHGTNKIDRIKKCEKEEVVQYQPLLQVGHIEPLAVVFAHVVGIAEREEPAHRDVDLGLLLPQEAGQWAQRYHLGLPTQQPRCCHLQEHIWALKVEHCILQSQTQAMYSPDRLRSDGEGLTTTSAVLLIAMSVWQIVGVS